MPLWWLNVGLFDFLRRAVTELCAAVACSTRMVVEYTSKAVVNLFGADVRFAGMKPCTYACNMRHSSCRGFTQCVIIFPHAVQLMGGFEYSCVEIPVKLPHYMRNKFTSFRIHHIFIHWSRSVYKHKLVRPSITTWTNVNPYITMCTSEGMHAAEMKHVFRR